MVKSNPKTKDQSVKASPKKEEKSISEIEEDLSFQIDKEGVPPLDVVSYNELRSSADLYRMFNEGILEIKPDFQREIVWSDSEQTRFIDSLIKQLPIPSMCFSLDHKTQQWKVIDGLQRMYTITRFLGNDSWKLSAPSDIDQSIAGKMVSEIKNSYPELYSRVQNITLPITVLRCDYSKKNHMEYMFMIFHRLNAGGLKLNNQEIRNAIFSGPFNDFLKNCNSNQKWKQLFRTTRSGIKDRFRKIELILRFFAFFDCYADYKGRLTSFLNDYMFKKRYEEKEISIKKLIFEDTVELISKISVEKSFSSTSNVVMEALMFGVAKNINMLKSKNTLFIKQRYVRLISSHPFSEEYIREGIMKKDKVIERLNVANRIFSGK